MKMLLSAAATALLLAGMAQAGIITYGTSLSGANESPAVISNGTGSATVVYNDTAHTLRVIASFSNLTGNTTASHIHCCTAAPGTGNIGVATQVPTFSSLPLGVTSGSFDQTLDLLQAASWNPVYITNNGGTAATAETALAAGLSSGRAYLNIHTSFAAGGEIRGFLVATPEPSTGLLLLVPAFALWLRRRTARS